MLTRMKEMRWKNPGLLGFVQILDSSAYVTARLDLLTPTVIALALLMWGLVKWSAHSCSRWFCSVIVVEMSRSFFFTCVQM